MMRATTPQVIVAGASLRERRERWVVRRQKMVKASSVPLSSPIRNGMAPRTDLERTLAGIWQEVLGCEGIGVEDNFLDLGGDSLIALRILARLRELFQVEISLKALLGSRSTVASLVLELVTELQRTQPAPAFSGRVDAVPR
jgi:acyl carrier protein